VIVRAHTKAGIPHLVSAGIACGLVAAILFAGRTIAIHFEQSTIFSTAPETFSLKNQGLAFQRAAAHAPDVLPLYGSSELILGVPDRASAFFRAAPTGFQVSPVGKVGTSIVIMLQKLGALGSDLRGKKIAISLTPRWFLMPWMEPTGYKGNFSLFAASEMTFGSTLDFQLKRDIALRTLEFPSTLTKSPLLEFALRRLASGRRLDRIVFCLLWPLGRVQNTILDLQDHFAALNYILHEAKPAPARHPKMLDWPKIVAEAGEQRPGGTNEDKKDKVSRLDEQMVAGSRDEWFRQCLDESPEWGNIELLLRTLAKIHAQPLLISMPQDGQYYDRFGVSPLARAAYYKKLRALARRYNVALGEFEEHDEDPAFLLPEVLQPEPMPSAHLAAKGWMFYNRVLDDFFHGRSPTN
jgi:D-alanine transfer protein